LPTRILLTRSQVTIGGVPGVVFFNAILRRLYVALGDPGY
jgi:hypothetical protein